MSAFPALPTPKASPEAIQAALETLGALHPLAEALLHAKLAGEDIPPHRLQSWAITPDGIAFTWRSCSCHSDTESDTLPLSLLHDPEERDDFLARQAQKRKRHAAERRRKAEEAAEARESHERQEYARLKARFG